MPDPRNHPRPQPAQQSGRPNPLHEPIFLTAESKAMLELARTLDVMMTTKEYAKAAKA
jgi:hypothetical protein